MSSRVITYTRQFGWLTYSLPCVALFACVGLSIFNDFENSTRTHCNVFNFLPSISAVVGGAAPQRYIWRLCFGLDSIPRYLIAYVQLKRLLNRHYISLSELYSFVQITNGCIHFLELTCLLLLSFGPWNEIFWIYPYSVTGFLICSFAHMFITILIDYFWPRTTSFRITDQEKVVRSKRLKWFILNIMSFFISVYFFFRHNRYCEPNIYSMHCLFEYFILLTNIAYHSVVMDEWDPRGGQI